MPPRCGAAWGRGAGRGFMRVWLGPSRRGASRRGAADPRTCPARLSVHGAYFRRCLILCPARPSLQSVSRHRPLLPPDLPASPFPSWRLSFWQSHPRDCLISPSVGIALLARPAYPLPGPPVPSERFTSWAVSFSDLATLALVALTFMVASSPVLPTLRFVAFHFLGRLILCRPGLPFRAPNSAGSLIPGPARPTLPSTDPFDP